MANKIDEVFGSDKILKIMTHVVAGYPDLKTNEKVIMAMIENGVDLIEIQIPFSDPLADGPTIMKASFKALKNGITPYDCFHLAERITGKTATPILLMTYGNIPWQIGLDRFIRLSRNAGVSGLIIPDLPYDEENGNYLEKSLQKHLYPIQLISPDIERQRLDTIISLARGFIYATLKVGITGARNILDNKSLAFVKRVKKLTSMPVAAGFGLSSPDQVAQLKGVVDCAIVGSHLINLWDQKGLAGINDFLRQCRFG